MGTHHLRRGASSPGAVFRMTSEIQSKRRLGLTATLIREDGMAGRLQLHGPKNTTCPGRYSKSRTGSPRRSYGNTHRAPEHLRSSYSIAKDARNSASPRERGQDRHSRGRYSIIIRGRASHNRPVHIAARGAGAALRYRSSPEPRPSQTRNALFRFQEGQHQGTHRIEGGQLLH